MRPEELRAFAELAGEAATGIADQARDVHVAVAARVFGALQDAGLAVAPVRALHDVIASGSHRAARELTGLVVRGGVGTGAELGRVAQPDARPLGSSVRGRIVLGALGGVVGDRLAERGSPLQSPLELFVDDRRGVSDRIAVFVHGLGETEHAWRMRGAGARPYGDRLAAECVVTPVYARYNSGLPIGQAGEQLAKALALLVEGWSCEAGSGVAEITLVGHSMGGLVAREACRSEGAERWRDHVRRTICLGSPHAGAPLARAARAAERGLSRLPETRPFASPLRTRTASIRDLADGSRAPFLSGADHYFVSASVSRDPDALAGRVLGDLLVLRQSAWAQHSRTERLPFDPSHYRHLGGATHFDLLAHPDVGELIVRWVGGGPSRATLDRGSAAGQPGQRP